MIINLNISADVDNLTLSEIYELLRLYSLMDNKIETGQIMYFKGRAFMIKADINMSINYHIKEMHGTPKNPM